MAFPILTFLPIVPLSFLVMIDAELDGPKTSFALYALLITSVASLVKSWLEGRTATRNRELDIQERAAVRDELKKNTDLTQEAVEQAKIAFSEANNTNAKIAALHAVQLHLMADGKPGEQAKRLAALESYLHDKMHDLSNVVQGLVKPYFS